MFPKGDETATNDAQKEIMLCTVVGTVDVIHVVGSGLLPGGIDSVKGRRVFDVGRQGRSSVRDRGWRIWTDDGTESQSRCFRGLMSLTDSVPMTRLNLGSRRQSFRTPPHYITYYTFGHTSNRKSWPIRQVASSLELMVPIVCVCFPSLFQFFSHGFQLPSKTSEQHLGRKAASTPAIKPVVCVVLAKLFACGRSLFLIDPH